jgi:uncharacterized protein YjbI with pentapeptide repeats
MTAFRRTIRTSLVFAIFAVAAAAQNLTCPARTGGKDFHGQTITGANFAYQDLTNANFSGATLVAPYFAHANLTGTNFQDAVIVNDGSNPTLVADFSFANLQDACFIRAQFNGPTYLANASLTCADFSETNLTNGNALFGESPLNIDRNRTNCRLAFRSSLMSCEFLSDWPFLDLSGANLRACLTQLSGRDFSNAYLEGVDLSGAVLDNMKFVNADLGKANLNRASLQNVDFSFARLFGAQLNNANLTDATLYNAYLSNNVGGSISNAASLRHAHLKNVNLSSAQLSGVDFSYSNFYGDYATAVGACKTALSRDRCNEQPARNYQGFTCGCAAAHGATMTETKFDSAYLFGVDFTEAKGEAADFGEAVLAGANFSGASFSSNPQGVVASFFRAYLQGANLEGAELGDSPNLSGAFVDFRPGGNNIYIFLDGINHNQFTCANCTPPTGTNVCVLLNYPRPTTVPYNTTLTCPNGDKAVCGPDDPNGYNQFWKSPLDIGNPPTGIPPAWYEDDATYTKAANPNSVCKNAGPDSAILFW